MQTRKFSNLMTKGEIENKAMITIYKLNKCEIFMKNLPCVWLYFRCKRPVCYTCMGSSKEDTFTMNGFKYSLVRHVSFVDCPGHDILMATMLNGAAVMDAALLLIGTKKTYVLCLSEGIIQSIIQLALLLFTENYTPLLF